jgi:hypothetical protein
MTPQEIAAATRDGRLRDVLARRERTERTESPVERVRRMLRELDSETVARIGFDGAARMVAAERAADAAAELAADAANRLKELPS